MPGGEHFALGRWCVQCPGTLIPHRGCRVAGTLVLGEKEKKEWRSVEQGALVQSSRTKMRGCIPE
jgi:hypothetical protein